MSFFLRDSDKSLALGLPEPVKMKLTNRINSKYAFFCIPRQRSSQGENG